MATTACCTMTWTATMMKPIKQNLWAILGKTHCRRYYLTTQWHSWWGITQTSSLKEDVIIVYSTLHLGNLSKISVIYLIITVFIIPIYDAICHSQVALGKFWVYQRWKSWCPQQLVLLSSSLKDLCRDHGLSLPLCNKNNFVKLSSTRYISNLYKILKKGTFCEYDTALPLTIKKRKKNWCYTWD